MNRYALAAVALACATTIILCGYDHGWGWCVSVALLALC
jgi:hypothetical protein